MSNTVATGIVNIRLSPQAITSFNQMKAAVFGTSTSMAAAGASTNSLAAKLDNLRQKTTGLKRDISAFRNDVLLVVFALAGVGREFKNTIDASVKFQIALAGVKSVALATGNDIGDVKEAAISLTKDGLLSLAGAAQGLKNLMATGLNLKQAVDLMRVFKDAASFNRQGILEYEEAIVRATSGVKMQNIRLIDDVGIRTRIAQMMKKQGYELEDLTDKTKKAGAVQALYSGLVNEGRYFIGDANKLTQTFAGTQAKLESQLLRTRAAFGDIVTGASGTESAFGGLYAQAFRLLQWLELMIVANKDLIKVKLDTYFNKIKQTLAGVWTILSPFLSALGTVANLLANSIVPNFLIWGLLITKLTSKFAPLLASFANFGKTNLFASAKQALEIGRLGKLAQSYSASILNARTFGANEGGGAINKMSSYVNSMAKSGATAFGMQSSAGLLKVSGQAFKNSFAQDVKVIQTQFAGLTQATIPAAKAAMKDLAHTYGLSGSQMAQMFPKTVAEMNRLQKITNLTSKNTLNFGQSVRLLGTSLKATAQSAWAAVAGFIKANAVMFAIQAAIVAAIWIWDKLNASQEANKEIQEKIASVRLDALKGEKEAFDSHLAELDSLEGLLTEYKDLEGSIEQNAQTQKRMADIQTKVDAVMKKYGASITGAAAGQNEHNAAVSDTINLQTQYADVLNTVIDKTKELRDIEIERLKNSIAAKRLAQEVSVGHQAYQDIYGIVDLIKLIKDQHVEDLLPDVSNLVALNKTALISLPGMSPNISGAFSFTKSERETGKALVDLYISSVKALEALRKKQDDYYKTLTPTINAGKALTAEQETTLLGFRKQEEGLLRVQAAMIKAGLASEDFTAQLAMMNKQLEETIAQGGNQAGLDAFMRFLENLRTKATKSKSYGSLGDKLIEALGTMQTDRLQLGVFVRKLQGAIKDESKEAEQLLKTISRNIFGKILEEGTANFRKLGKEIELARAKLEGAPEDVVRLELAMKKLSEAEKFEEMQKTLAGAKSALLSRRIDMLKKVTATQAQSEEFKKQFDEINSLINLVGVYQGIVSSMKSSFTSNLDLEGNRELAKFYFQQRESLRAVNQETFKEISSMQLRNSLLRKTSSEQELINTKYSQANELQDYQDKIAKANQAKWLAVLANDLILADAYSQQEESLKGQVDTLKAIHAYTLAIQEANAGIAASDKARNRNLTSAISKTTYSGAMVDIGSGGGGALEAITTYDTAVQNAVDKWKTLSALTDMESEQWWEYAGEFQDAMLTANENVFQAFENTFSSIAKFAEDTFDIFGLKSWEASENIKYNLITDQKLLNDQFAHREITVAEYEAQRTLLNKKASIETRKNAALESAEQKIAIGNTLKSLALEFAVRALAATALGFLGNPSGFKSAAAYSAAAALAGGTGIALAKSGITDKAKAEAEARLAETLAERDATRTSGTTTSTDTGGKSIGGSIQAQELHIYISPTTTISGETIIISNIGIEEAKQILADATVERIQEAIDNRELQLVPK